MLKARVRNDVICNRMTSSCGLNESDLCVGGGGWLVLSFEQLRTRSGNETVLVRPYAFLAAAGLMN